MGVSSQDFLPRFRSVLHYSQQALSILLRCTPSLCRDTCRRVVSGGGTSGDTFIVGSKVPYMVSVLDTVSRVIPRSLEIPKSYS